jgi:hypothetical protein
MMIHNLLLIDRFIKFKDIFINNKEIMYFNIVLCLYFPLGGNSIDFNQL